MVERHQVGVEGEGRDLEDEDQVATPTPVAAGDEEEAMDPDTLDLRAQV